MILPIPDLPITGVELVSVGEVCSRVLQELVPGLEERFEVEAMIGGEIPIEAEWLDQGRDQYRAGPILDRVIEARGGGDEHPGEYPPEKTLGVIDADLFAPNLSFIFGQAIVGGCCGIIGLARLRPEFYHEEPDADLFARRTLIEAVHEIGHTVGLDHCPRATCVMNFSRTIEDSDRKGPDLCPDCLGQIR